VGRRGAGSDGAGDAGDASPLFGFVQFEFPWRLGPADGRYVLRGHAGVPAHVLVLETLGSAERRLLGRARRPRRAVPEPPPEPVPTSRATLIGAEPFATQAEADAWRSGLEPEVEVARAIVTLNAVLHAQRAAAADPWLREVARDQALVVRIGLGAGDDVAHGRWRSAVTVPAPPGAGTRRSSLRSQERLAALLGGRDAALACEELALRARADLDAGRLREAALQLRVALEAALAELVPWAERAGLAARLEELRSERGPVGAAANRAVQGGLDAETAADVERVLGRLEAALRVRTVTALDALS
jgi:hypothetical protein